MMSNPGARGGWSWLLPTQSQMVDKGMQPTLEEQLQLGKGKADNSVVYSHYEYRNYNRGDELPRGKVK